MIGHNLWVRLQGDVMDRVNLPFFLDFGATLKLLVDFPKVTHINRVECILAGLRLKNVVEILLKSYPDLTVCRGSGMKLGADIDNLMKSYQESSPEERVAEDLVIDFPYNAMIAQAREFQTVLTAELSTLEAYQVSPKGIYSTSALIDHAENALSDEVKVVLNNQAKQTIDDTNQAGRCLALDLPTASGFHIMRAVETVLKAYRVSFGASMRGRSWGAYIVSLKGTGASPKVLGILDQIKDLHRNPTIHPDIVLSPDEAAELFAIAQSAISAMVRDMIANNLANTTPASQSATGSNVP